MGEGLALVVRFYLKPGCDQDFDRLVAETASKISELEPGTLVYVSHTPEGEPNQRVFYELYRDREAFGAHEAQAHVKHFLSERDRFIERFDVEFLTEKQVAGASFQENKQ